MSDDRGLKEALTTDAQLRREAREARERRIRHYHRIYPEEESVDIARAFGCRIEEVRRILKEQDIGTEGPSSVGRAVSNA